MNTVTIEQYRFVSFCNGSEAKVIESAFLQQTTGEIFHMKALHHKNDGAFGLVVQAR